MRRHGARNRMDPPSAAADRATPALSSVPDAKTLVSVGELKRNSLRDFLRRIHDRASSVLSFSIQWKDLEDHYAAAEASLKRRAEELEALEGSVARKLKEAGRRARMLGDRSEAAIRFLEDKSGGLAAREKGFFRLVEERLREVEEIERRAAREEAAVWEEMRRRGEELNGLFEKIRFREEMLQRRDMDLEFREKLVEDMERELEEGMRVVSSKERELSLKRKELDGRLDQVRIIEEELVRREREIESSDEEIKKKLKVVGLKEKMFEDWHKEIESKKKDIDERLKEVHLREKRLAECSKENDLCSEEVNENYEMKMTELKLMEKRLEEGAKQVAEKKMEVNRITGEADLNKKTIKDPRKGVEEQRKVCGSSMERFTLTKRDTEDELVKKGTFAEVQTMLDGALSRDGKALKIFLIENWETDGSSRHIVFEIIKASPNPARLVLDALKAFYPSHNERDNAESKCNIFRKEICLLLLEELRNISPEIGQTEKEEAVKLSLLWHRQLKGDAEIVNFFNLLAACKLASSYFDDTLLKSVGRVRYSRKMPELCQVLGFTDKIPGETFVSKHSQSNELSGKVDGKSLKIIFSAEVDYDKACEKAYELLHASPDPSMLVLDALKDNVSSELSKEDGSKSGIPLEVCIKLLELLKRLSPAVSRQLYKDAKEFAVTWKSNLKARADDYVGIVCFLLFLSAFKLSSAFDAGEIVGLLEPASWRKHVLHTCEILGLKDAIPDFIQRLIEKKNWPNAIKYAHTFGMEDRFPPEPLLKDYLAYWENKAGDLCKAHPGSSLVQMNAVEKMLTATRVVIKCVNFYKLESRCLMKDLEARVQQLEKQKAGIAMKLEDSNIEHLDGSNSPALEQETVYEPTATGNSPCSCLNDNAQVSANMQSSAKAAFMDTSLSASSKDNAQVSADTSTFAKAVAFPGKSPSASSNADARVSADVATCSRDAESGSASKTEGKRPWTSAPPDHYPQSKRQAQGHPCREQAVPEVPLNPAWKNCGPPPPYPRVNHPRHPYQFRPPHIPGRMPGVPLHNGWPAPYPNPRNLDDGRHLPHRKIP